ncbi:MAG TPA: hypothetical protein VMW66_04215 [Elusimicrobiales bacterium]|nr:hypothetical protein [Elusimicrobiales bacterium]
MKNKILLLAIMVFSIFIISCKQTASNEQTVSKNQRFKSPQGKIEIEFTELAHKKVTEKENLDYSCSFVDYKIDFYKLGTNKKLNSTNYREEYQCLDLERQPISSLVSHIKWSPKEDYAFVTDEEVVSYPSPTNGYMVALNEKLKWKKARFCLENYFWIDDLTILGNCHRDCDYSVRMFRGRTGEDIAVAQSMSPIGYEIFERRKDAVLIHSMADNCQLEDTVENMQKQCFLAKFETPLYKILVKCPEEANKIKTDIIGTPPTPFVKEKQWEWGY